MSEKSLKPHRNLVAWQKGMDLVMAVYKLTRDFPEREVYGLSSQLRRAALPVPSNIAEGHARASTRESLHHLSIARGSLAETETQLLVALKLGYLVKTVLRESWEIMQEVGKLLNRLMQSLERKESAE